MKKEKKKSALFRILDYAGNYKILTYLGMILSAIAMAMGMVPYVYIWKIVNELIKCAPNFEEANNIVNYGWIAFVFSAGQIVIYFIGLMCTHLAAFKTASNIRKIGMKRILNAQLGFFEDNASGLLKNKLNAAASDTESLLAHSLADISGAIVMFVSLIVLIFAFDWRMGCACLLAVIISISTLFLMMGGKNAIVLAEYKKAQDNMSKSATEYVRGIPVVKIFQQTVYSFRNFKNAIDNYSEKAYNYSVDLCSVPQTINLTAIDGIFMFLVPVAMFIAPKEIASGNAISFMTNFAFYAIFSAITSTALNKIMYTMAYSMEAESAINRIEQVMDAPQIVETKNPKMPKDSSIEFRNVSFRYSEDENYAIKNVSFRVEKGKTLALVGHSGGGKTTIARLISRFWDVTSGEILIGGVNVKDISTEVLMEKVSFVFQDCKLFKASIYENVRCAKKDATREEVVKALEMAQCLELIKRLPYGIDTVIGSKGTFLSGGEQQRIAIARAILKDASIIVLDEATAFSDPENEVLIQKAIKSLTKEKTVVMIAHRLSTVVGADDIIVLENGKIEEEGNHKQLLFNKKLYDRMWGEYNQAVKWKIQTTGGVE